MAERDEGEEAIFLLMCAYMLTEEPAEPDKQYEQLALRRRLRLLMLGHLDEALAEVEADAAANDTPKTIADVFLDRALDLIPESTKDEAHRLCETLDKLTED